MLRGIVLICPAIIAFGALLVYGEDVVEGSGVQEEGLDIDDNGDAAEYFDNLVSENKDIVTDIEQEFDYFYNLEMMEKLENNTLDDSDSFLDDELERLYDDPAIYDEEMQRNLYESGPDSEYYEDSEEFDNVLDDLLLEEDLLETDVDKLDIEIFQHESVDDPIKTEVEKPMSIFNLNLILLILLLASSVIVIIMACTTCRHYRRVDTEDKFGDKSRKNVIGSSDDKKRSMSVITPPHLWV